MFAFPPSGPSAESRVRKVIEAETRRQWQKLVLIPSESICHPDAAAVLATPFSNIYAEGRPEPPLMHDPREAAPDPARFESWQTRLADGRYYRGCLNANRIELMAQERVARVFAALDGSPPPCGIRVCVQALSGAPANTAVYEALLEHGDGVLGLDLTHGGHLTHGSEFNYSGRTFRVRSYGIDPDSRRLNYESIREIAREHRPKLIIGGASSYPWDFDWAELRSIADEVGAYLLADIAHLAGMVAAGLLNNPVPHAHVVAFTTHKTLCGPRGAVIITTYPELAAKLSAGVFPGLQGGPHVHTIAAIARLFEIISAQRADFTKLQRAILDNAAFLAECLCAEGFELEYGGTNTHMLLATQRGITRDQIREVASVIKSILSEVRTFRVWVPAGEERCRGKIPADVTDNAARRVRAIIDALPYPPQPTAAEPAAHPPSVGDRVALLLRGDKVRLALGQMLTCPVEHLGRGQAAAGQMLRNDGGKVDDVVVVDLGMSGREERFALLPHESKLDEVLAWVRGLSDGYLLFDENDLYAKIDGPTVVEPLPKNLVGSLPATIPAPSTEMTKPYFIGQRTVAASAKEPTGREYAYNPPDLPLRRTLLNETHKALGGKMVPFAGWEMPVQYPDGIFAEHRAVRTAAGLFDIAHMSLFEVSGKHSLAFLDVVLANCVSRLDPGEAQYTYMLRPDGTALDDLYVYRLGRDRFMLVANAANAERDWDWLNAVNSREYVIDLSMPGKKIEGQVTIRNLREDGLVGLALQGPVSARLLCHLADSSSDRYPIERLEQNRFLTATVAGVDCTVARTGYTGEPVGFELYVHPSQCVGFWNTLLDEGRALGVLPAALGARDSTRTEAGFPLFGHELEGHCSLTLTEAGYGFVTRFHVPFFIGRDSYIERTARSRGKVIRLAGCGRRSVRPGHVLIDTNDVAIGRITSFAYTKPDFTFFALAALKSTFPAEPGMTVRVVRETSGKYRPPAQDATIVELEVMTRFPEDEERASWPESYA